MTIQSGENPDVAGVSAVLTHVSLMTASLAFVYQMGDRLNATVNAIAKAKDLVDVYNLQRSLEVLAEMLGTPQTRMLLKEPQNEGLGFSDNFHNLAWFARLFRDFVDISVPALMFGYLLIAIACLFYLGKSQETPHSRFHHWVIFRFSIALTIVSVILIMLIVCFSPIYNTLYPLPPIPRT